MSLQQKPSAVQAAADKAPVVQADKEAISRTQADAAAVLKDEAPDLEVNRDSDSIQGRYISLLQALARDCCAIGRMGGGSFSSLLSTDV